MKRHAFVPLVVVLLASVYALWRVDVLPGLWDVRHWNVDVAAQAERERAAHRQARLHQFRTEAAAARVHAYDQEATGAERAARSAVVFLGSSTMERFDLGRAFPGAATLNRGIGDEPAALLLERLDVGIDWAAVDGVVLYAASVDFRRLLESAAECTARVEAVLAAIRARAPTQPLLLLGLLSQRDLDDPGRQRLIDLDKQLARLAARFDATYLSLDRAPLTEPDGTLSREHSVDRFHLNQSGYQVLAEWIRNNGGPLVPLLFP